MGMEHLEHSEHSYAATAYDVSTVYLYLHDSGLSI